LLVEYAVHAVAGAVIAELQTNYNKAGSGCTLQQKVSLITAGNTRLTLSSACSVVTGSVHNATSLVGGVVSSTLGLVGGSRAVLLSSGGSGASVVLQAVKRITGVMYRSTAAQHRRSTVSRVSADHIPFFAQAHF
jgi:hypothetical protein